MVASKTFVQKEKEYNDFIEEGIKNGQFYYENGQLYQNMSYVPQFTYKVGGKK